MCVERSLIVEEEGSTECENFGRAGEVRSPHSAPSTAPMTSASRRGLRSPDEAEMTDLAGPQSVSDLAYQAVNRGLAAVLLVTAAPIFLVIALTILFTDGRPVFYWGQRLGRHKRPFMMLKFRTLTNGASTVIGSQLLSHKHGMVIRYGSFLRDTRLDELPQLVNVLKGEMNLFGPRPVRREVYERVCELLPGYGHRFAVKPGLVGFSQLFTPHSAPKRLRAFIDRRALRTKSMLRDLLFVGYAGSAVVTTAVVRLVRYLPNEFIRSRVLGLSHNQRVLRRTRPRKAKAYVDAKFGSGATLLVPIVDINEEALRFDSPRPISGGADNTLELRIEVKFRRHWRRNSKRVRVARCVGKIQQRRRTDSGWSYVIEYVPQTQTSHYVIHQYLLRRSLINPFVS